MGIHGGLELVEGPDGTFTLRYRPTAAVLTARAGERLRYPGRAAHAEVDWLRLPVAGISGDDAAAYAEWLRRSGRVRGARLCTEREWEQAARGGDDREYPSGDRLPAAAANYDVTHGSALGLCEVGSHPDGRSPFGLDDMAGNVWEWVVPVLSTAP